MFNGLITNWDTITFPGVILSFLNLVDKINPKYLRILITKPWREIISNQKAMSQILNKRDVIGTIVVDNNADIKNAYTKDDFDIFHNIYVFIGANTSDLSDIKDINYISSANNNFDIWKTCKRANFDNYNMAYINISKQSNMKDSGNVGDVSNNFYVKKLI